MSCSRFQAGFSPGLDAGASGYTLAPSFFLDAVNVIHFPLLTCLAVITARDEHLMEDVGAV